VNAGVLNVANVIVGPGIQPQGAVVGNWIAYTPTLGVGAVRGTNTEKAYWRQVGSALEITYDYTQTGAGTAGSGQYTWSLPSGYTVDTGKVILQTSNLGNIYAYNGTTEYTGYVIPATSTSIGINLFTSISVVANASQSQISFGNATQLVQFRATIPVNELAGSGTVNLAQNDVEYAYNTSATTASDTTSFGYGPTGVITQAFAPTLTNSVSKRVRFLTPIQATDELVLEVSIGNTGRWVNINQGYRGFLSNDAGTTYTGASLEIANSTDVDAVFYSAKFPGSAWTTADAWRIKKIKAGQAVGFGIVNPGTSSGLVAAAGLPGNTTGNAIATGYVGEVLEANLASSSAQSTVSGVYKDVGSLTLTKGIWLISAAVGYYMTGTTNAEHVDNYISIGSANAGPSAGAEARSTLTSENRVLMSGKLDANAGGSDLVLPIPPYVVVVTAATQVFRFGGHMIYSIGTVTQYGSMQAVRTF
jgi:hypothetical protein